MTAEGHIIFAIASAIFAKRAELTPVMASADWWHLVPAALLTCLLPDIDHPKSVLGQRLKWLSQPIARAFGHRGFTHSLLAGAASPFPFYINLPADWFLPTDFHHGHTRWHLTHHFIQNLTPPRLAPSSPFPRMPLPPFL
ncbi:metal-dependent hydrolase, partial [Pantoea dispersa]|uniref:metal-dependent hydrolase n=1 Tax=Pantoea dispersa TaxID=59814 RepID=UPI003016121E